MSSGKKRELSGITPGLVLWISFKQVQGEDVTDYRGGGGLRAGSFISPWA